MASTRSSTSTPARVAGTWDTPGVVGHRDTTPTCQGEPGVVIDPAVAARLGLDDLSEPVGSHVRTLALAALLISAAAMIVVPVYSYVLRLGVSVFTSLAVPIVIGVASVIVALTVGRGAQPGSRMRAGIGAFTVGVTVSLLVVCLTALIWAVI